MLNRRILDCCLILCIALNTLMPRFSVSPERYDQVMDLIMNQAPLINFCILSSIPLKIISDYLSEQNSAAAPARKGSGHTDQGQNSSSEYLSPEHKAGTQKLEVCFVDAVRTELTACCLPVPGQATVCLVEREHILFLVLLLLLFFLLPRGNVNEDRSRIHGVN